MRKLQRLLHPTDTNMHINYSTKRKDLKRITPGSMFESGNRHARNRKPIRLSTARCQNQTVNDLFFPAVLSIMIFTVCAAQTVSVNIGAIINDDTQIGKEMKASMIVAAKRFNDSSSDRKISLQFRNSGGNPLQAAYAAEELIKKEDAKVIIGMETWEETTLVANVGNRTQVPIISFASSATRLPAVLIRSPFLIQMASNTNEQIRCVASILHSFGWRKVIPIYEVDSYGGDSGIFSALSDALRDIGAEIEYRVVLPPFSSLSSDPKAFVSDLLVNVLSKQSRVFVVHLSSYSYAIHLFREAKQLRLVEKDSVWIVTEPIASQLDSFNPSAKEKMDGALGIRTYFSEENESILALKTDFQTIFESQYGKRSPELGIHALRAYDAVGAIANAINSTNGSDISLTMLGRAILSRNFTGLSGHVSFRDGKLSQASIFRIINVVGTGYKKLGFWSSELGFLNNLIEGKNNSEVGGTNMNVLTASISWPGDMSRVPKGWSMPSDAEPLKIGIPGRTSFEKFVKVPWNHSTQSKDYSGFCIDVFHEVLQILEEMYPLPHVFMPSNCTYDELVQAVANKTFDAVIGDVTILANRSKSVEFTQPFAESGLVMVVVVKSHEENKASIFLKPFTWEMWIGTAAILIYTILIVWLLERQSNPEFEGPWRDQISIAVWFTCSSIFFSHREKITNNYTRAVVLVWFFVALVLTSSYTANLSSILTVPRLEPNVTDIEFLKANNETIGCDGDSFIRKYLEEVIHFKPEFIKNISTEYAYPDELKSGNISAAFLELPYEKAFINHYCEGFMVAGNTTRHGGDRFGGLGFVFQKGSPIATDVSEAILTLSENGRLKQLEVKYFSPSLECSKMPDKFRSLNWPSFLGLFLFSVGASTICYLIFIVPQVHNWCWFNSPE